MPTTPVPAAVSTAAREAGEDVEAALTIADGLGRELPLPGGGSTAARFDTLAALGRANLTVARVVEAHCDALAILREAGHDDVDGTWGVFAAEAPGARLDAVPAADGYRLSGTKPWCSLADRVDHALVTAHVGEQRQLFRVALRQPGVRVDPPEGWVSRGLRTVTSTATHYDDVPTDPVGEVGWYLTRPGFAWGGVGVAACWYGGTEGVADTLRRVAAGRARPLDELHLGAADVELHAARTALAHAASCIDTGGVADPALLALRTRSVVAAAAERVLQQVAHALGPAPLTFDENHARQVADLEVYVRQHHGERDLASLGSALLGRA